MKIFVFAAAALAAPMLEACSPPRSTSSADLAAISGAAIATRLLDPSAPAALRAAAETPIAKYYEALLATTTDEPVAIDGQVVSGLHTALLNSAYAFAVLDARYGTLGAILKTSTKAAASASVAQLEASQTYRGLAEDYAGNAGLFAAIKSPANVMVIAAPSEARPLDPQSQLFHNLAALPALAIALSAQGREPNAGLALDTFANCQNAVVDLNFNSTSGIHGCKGVFVNDHQALTAAHCVKGAHTARFVDANGQKVYSTSYQYNPFYNVNYPGAAQYAEGGTLKFDVGLVNFPKNTAPGVAQINPSAPNLSGTCAFTGLDMCEETNVYMANGLIMLGDSGSATADNGGPGASGAGIFQDGMVVGVIIADGQDECAVKGSNLGNPSNQRFLERYLD